MKMSLTWLNEFVDAATFLKNPQALSELLTQGGLEVESIENQNAQLKNVVVGLILEKEQHPQAQKLSVCKVMTGEGVIHQIVCGASNHKRDDRVAVALPGAILPGNFEIKPTVLRGVESGGMLCSKKELGIEATENDSGILILDESAKIGETLSKYLGLNDVIFELKVTPNRADCLSHWGLAREVSALSQQKLKVTWPPTVKTVDPQGFNFKVQSVACSRYSGRLIEGVKVKDSPDWVQRRLKNVGLKPINNVVDIANLVMMELGQPLHAFDADSIEGHSLIIRSAERGELFKALDQKEYALQGHELVIADPKKALCLAGVVGGINSGTTFETRNIFLESACFSASSVRKTARSHGIQTDSAYRFSRGVDPEMTLTALNRAAELIIEVAGGRLSDWIFDSGLDLKKNPKALPIQVKVQTVTDRLGYPAKFSVLKDYLERLQFKIIETHGEESLLVEAPGFRFDIEHEMDIIEEYARLFGYDKIPEAPLKFATFPKKMDPVFMSLSGVHEALQRVGATEALHSLFTSKEEELNFSGSRIQHEFLPLKNPLTEKMNSLRQTLSFGLFQNLCRNYSYGNESGFLYEIGKTIHQSSSGVYSEVWKLGIISWGEGDQVLRVQKALLGIDENLKVKNSIELHPSLHPYQQGLVVSHSQEIGCLGAIHPLVLESNKIRCQGALAEVSLEVFFKQKIGEQDFIQQPSRFQKVSRDLSLIFEEGISVGAFVDEMKLKIGSNCISVEVIDVYKGPGLKEGASSITLRFFFQDPKANLQEAWVQTQMDEILKTGQSKYGAELR